MTASTCYMSAAISAPTFDVGAWVAVAGAVWVLGSEDTAGIIGRASTRVGARGWLRAPFGPPGGQFGLERLP
jgi:hypothetical protein